MRELNRDTNLNEVVEGLKMKEKIESIVRSKKEVWKASALHGNLVKIPLTGNEPCIIEIYMGGTFAHKIPFADEAEAAAFASRYCSTPIFITQLTSPNKM